MPVTWTTPTVLGAPHFALWEGAYFGLVRDMFDGTWRASLFRDGDSMRSQDAWVNSEAKAKEFIERWAKYHYGSITAKPPKRSECKGTG